MNQEWVGEQCRITLSHGGFGSLNTTPSILTGLLKSWGYWQGMRDADVA
jgi:hypothetical protein